MSIETDESLWPEGAQWYGPEDSHMEWKEGFYKHENYIWYFKTSWSAWQKTTQSPLGIRKLIPRPTAPWPQVGVECEFSITGGKWTPCKIVGRDGYWFWLDVGDCRYSLHYPTVAFRPNSTLRDEVFGLVTKVIYDNSIEGLGGSKAVADRVTDLVMAEFDLTRKEKTDI